MEADFQSVYGLDLLDLWRGTMTPRKAAVLAMALPAGSAVWRSVGIDAAWTFEMHMAANVVDVLQVANWQRTDGKGPQPVPMPRPGDDARVKVKSASLAGQAARFRARQRQREAAPDGS